MSTDLLRNQSTTVPLGSLFILLIDFIGHNIVFKLVAVLAHFQTHIGVGLMPRAHILHIRLIDNLTVLNFIGDHVDKTAVGEKLIVDPEGIQKGCQVENEHHHKEPDHHSRGILIIGILIHQMSDKK
jgi:hypothetical protein